MTLFARSIATSSLLITLGLGCASPDQGVGFEPSPSVPPSETAGSPATIDGQLDCPTAAYWAIDEVGVRGMAGEPTIDAAVDQALATYRVDGDRIHRDGAVATLIHDGREVVAARATTLEAGGYAVQSLRGCEGTER